MCTLRVKCVFCGLIIDCPRDDTAKLLAHLQNDHPEMAHYQPKATQPGASVQPAEASENDHSSTGSSSQGHDSETEELLQRVRIAAPTSSRHSSSSSSTSTEEDASHAPAHRQRPSQGSFASERLVLYQTSLSSWRLGGRPICCPNCGATRMPIVRAHSNGVTWSSTVASCFLFCWPLCCLSWFLSQPTSEYLHCVRCDQLLGEHDIKAEAIVPNYAVLDGVED
uniref:LITAF domain-containing protein n=1 Tax=Anopheles dirus TaxID=7168 RepID=A0A182NFG8_9DIPT